MRDPSPLITDAHDRVRAMYAPEIGRRRAELSTPALLLDLPTLRANLQRMATGMQGTPTTLRAHVKVDHPSVRAAAEEGMVKLFGANWNRARPIPKPVQPPRGDDNS